MSWLRRLLTKGYKSDSVYLLSAVQDDINSLVQVDRYTRIELYKRLRNAVGQLRIAVSSRNVVQLEFAAVELLTALDVLDGIRAKAESEKATEDKPIKRRKVSTRRN